MNRIIKFWLFCFCVAPANSLFALEPPAALSPTMLEKLLEASFERNLGAWFEATFPAQSFLVTSEVELAPRTTADPVALPPIFAPAPGAPGLYQSLPEYWQQSSRKINRLTVHLLVSQSFAEMTYSDLYHLIIPVAGIELTRGDLLEIEQIRPIVSIPAEIKWPARRSGNFSVPELESALPVITGILILLFLTILFLSRKIRWQAKTSIHRAGLKDDRKPTGNVGKLISEILPQVEKNPDVAAKVLEVWITQSPGAGAQNGAQLYRSLPATHQKQIRNYFSHEKFRLLEQAGASKNFPPDADRVLLEFQWDFFRLIQYAANPVRCEDLGAGLLRLSTLQVESLLQKVTREMKAIILAQLPPGRAVLHLKIMPEKTQQKLVWLLVRLSEIPAAIYSQLEQIISGETKILTTVRPVRFDGLAFLREIWEAADPGLRDDLQHTLREFDVTFRMQHPSAPLAKPVAKSTNESVASIQTIPVSVTASSGETGFPKKRIRSPERRLERFRRIK